MGVSGAGKTHVGQAVAAALEWRFFDADDFHSEANIIKMRAGTPLTDEDRWPWLLRLHELLRDERQLVLACSALKRDYRNRLLHGIAERVLLVYLHAPEHVIRQRLQARQGHYMPASLLTSQFAALEPPDEGEALWLQAHGDLVETVRQITDVVRRSA